MDMDRLLYTVDAMKFEAERLEAKCNATKNYAQADIWEAVAKAYDTITKLLTDAEYADHMARYYVDDEPWHTEWD